MEIANRSELEADVARVLARLMTRQRAELLDHLGRYGQRTVPQDYWLKLQEETQRDLLPLLALLFMASAVQHGMDETEAQQRAEAFSRDRANVLAGGLVANSQQALRAAQDEWLAGRPTISQVKSAALDIFGPDRAAKIAGSETTSTRHKAAEIAKSESDEGLSEEDRWFTSSQPNVCKVCEPLHDTPRSVWAEQFPDGPPSPHPNCNCFIRYAGEPMYER